MKILFTGDLFITDEYPDANLPDDSVLEAFHHADCRVVNLEAPITPDNPANRILKTGPHLNMAPGVAIPFLKGMGVNLVTLANNHIMDYGPRGLEDTMAELEAAGIGYVGAGTSIEEARKPFVMEKEGLRIAFLNFAENEWSAALDGMHGVSPMDIIDNANQIAAAAAKFDRVIVVIHGGHEYYMLPSPRMVKQYRFYADNGADAVIGHHTHCISGYEDYHGVPIFYGLGNFLFTKPSTLDVWFRGLMASIDLGDEKVSHRIIPVEQHRSTFRLKTCEGDAKDETFREIEKLRAIIADNRKLRKYWNIYVKDNHETYLEKLSPVGSIGNRHIRNFMLKVGLHKLFFREYYKRELLNRLRCEAHRDVSLEVLKSIIYDEQ